METYEIYEASPDEIRLVRAWATRHPVTTEPVDASTICVHMDSGDLEDDFAEFCDAYDLKTRLL